MSTATKGRTSVRGKGKRTKAGAAPPGVATSWRDDHGNLCVTPAYVDRAAELVVGLLSMDPPHAAAPADVRAYFARIWAGHGDLSEFLGEIPAAVRRLVAAGLIREVPGGHAAPWAGVRS